MKLTLILIILCFFSCTNYETKRHFFLQMRENYSNRFLDSTNIIKNFGLLKEGKTIYNQEYYLLKGDKHSLFNFLGFINFDGSKLFFLPEDYESCEKYLNIKKLIVFDLNNLDSMHKIYYTCSSNYCSGDVIEFVNKRYIKALEDTIYTFNFKRFQYSIFSNTTYIEDNQKLIEFSREKGLVKCIIPQGYDSLSWSFFPEFKVIDTGNILRRTPYKL